MYILSLTYVRYGKKIAYGKLISRMYPLVPKRQHEPGPGVTVGVSFEDVVTGQFNLFLLLVLTCSNSKKTSKS